MQTLFVDNLTVVDFSYFHPQRGIVGESLILDVALSGELNQEGMLFDFSFVKKRIKSHVDNIADHKFLVAKQYKNLVIDQSPQQLSLKITCENGDIYHHISPPNAVRLIDSEFVTPESICEDILLEVKAILPDNVSKIALSLREETIQESFYHYSHGLKKHFGDCQRIAHGHRSKILVWQDDQYSKHWSEYVANLWLDIYLATKEDIKESSILDNKPYWTFQYHANQGLFELTIPQDRCFLIETDTTVELIALYLAEHIKTKIPNSKIEVKAFEGVDKGAIATV